MESLLGIFIYICVLWLSVKWRPNSGFSLIERCLFREMIVQGYKGINIHLVILSKTMRKVKKLKNALWLRI